MTDEGTVNLCNHCTRTERCCMRKKNPDQKVLDCARYSPTEMFANLVRGMTGLDVSRKK